ncbi:glycosyltransferase 87 family protein [Streptacidiphilus sp. MAP12-20]|uniref:glycosyltransferase 87 family protein n=1 Tax=Streptacidiphilus sp. MAP12-20 TaxID=3156299 RepID=UPI003514A2B2
MPDVLALPLRRLRPLTRPRLLAALGAGVLTLAVALWWWSIKAWPYAQWQQGDLRVYWDGARSLHHGQHRLYTANFGPARLPFIYPPFAALLFLPGSWFGFDTVRAAMLTLSLLALLASSWASWRLLGYRRGPARTGAVLLTTGLALWLEPVQWTLMWGQVNLLLLALVLVDLALPRGSRWRGVGTGIAVGIKLTPGLFVLHLLLTRQYRAAVRAGVVAAGTVLLGWALLPSASATYWWNLGRISSAVNARIGLFAINNQSLRGLLIRLYGSHPDTRLLDIACCAALVVFGLPLAALIARRGGRAGELAGAILCGVLSLLVSPVAWSHHWVWVVPGLALAAHAALRLRARIRSAARWLLPAAYCLWFAAWPLRLPLHSRHHERPQPLGLFWLAPHRRSGELRWTFVQGLVGNAIVLSGLAFVLAVAVWAVRRGWVSAAIWQLRPLSGRRLLVLGSAGYAGSLLLRALMVRHWPFMGAATPDLATYYGAVLSLHHGQQALYAQEFGPWPGPFIYPPIAALAFLALAPLGLHGLQHLAVVLDQFALLAVLAASWSLLGRRFSAGATGLLLAAGGVALWLVPVERTIFFGQVSLVLLAAVLVDCALPDRFRSKGVLIGLAAGVKLVPGLFVLYFLVTRRWRAAAVASATFAATVVVGALALPKAARTYWFHTIGLPQRINSHVSLADAANQSLRALLLRTLGDGRAASLLWAVLSLAVLVLGLLAARRAEVRGQRLLAVCLCGGIGLLVSPISWTHHWVWAVPALLLMGHHLLLQWRPPRRRLAWATLLAGLAVTLCWPLALDPHGYWSRRQPPLPTSLVLLGPHQDGRDLHWTAAQWLVGNSLVLFGLAVFAGVVRALLRSTGPATDPVPPARTGGAKDRARAGAGAR